MFEFRLSKRLKNKKIKLRFKEDIEPQEIFLDSLAQKKEEELGISEKKFEVPLLKKILQGLLIFILVLILALFAKTFQLQVIRGKTLSALAEENKFIIHRIQAERGVIYDRDFNQLVFNRPSFDLILEIANLPQDQIEKERILKEVSQIIKGNLGDLRNKIETSQVSIVPIFENLDHQTLILLETKIDDLPGFQTRRNIVRHYQDGEIFSHLIGYTGKITAEELKAAPELYSIFDYVGRDGIEKSYEEILRKNSGKLRVERDALGNIVSREVIQLPQSGKSLVLWLNSALQKKIAEELEKGIRQVGSKKAVAVALDPKTGGVLSLVSLPNFNNNLFQKGADPKALQNLLEDPLGLEPLFNRAISGRYLTGSTIKPLIASAALEEKIISPQKNIHCAGKIVIPNPWVPDAFSTKEDWTIHGWTDLRKAIAESCNVYFYTIGGGFEDQEGLGPTKIKEYLELFGWSDITGIDLPGEAEGFIPDKEWKKEKWGESWWDGDTYNLAIGQGFLQITPLEVVNSFAAIANEGKLFQPQIVKEIVDSEKNLVDELRSSSPFAEARVIEEIKPKIIRQNFISPENIQIVREGMREAVTYGSAASWLSALPVKAAAKTGTAELGNNYYHNWVTVFAPYQDPQIVLTVMIENVKAEQVAALPIAKAILEWYFTQ